VAPKKAKLKEAEAAHGAAIQSLEIKRSKLREIQAKLKNLTETLEINKTKKQNLEFQVCRKGLFFYGLEKHKIKMPCAKG
jgi:hypothetical protein